MHSGIIFIFTPLFCCRVPRENAPRLNPPPQAPAGWPLAFGGTLGVEPMWRDVIAGPSSAEARIYFAVKPPSVIEQSHLYPSGPH